MTLKVYVYQGLPASGKSSAACKLIDKNPGEYKRVNKDLLRKMLDNSHYTKDNEKFVLHLQDMIILEALKEGKHVIVDNTNLLPAHIERIKQLVKGLAEVWVDDSFLQVPVEECIKRDLQRLDSVGKDVIMQMYNKYLKKEPTPVKYVEGLPDAVIFDLDGTLSLLNGRNPYDASTCEQDLPNPQVVELYHLYKDKYKVILCSGREDKYREQTEKWLVNHNIKYAHLYMRKTDDFRKDNIIKTEIYEEHIALNYNVKVVIDDRRSVVKAWRELGLTVFQVAEGDF
jgi:predicted kinase